MLSLPAIISTLGVGGLLGYGAGLVVRSVTRLVGCMLGVVFILMQVLAYYGLAEWHWDRIADLITGPGASAAPAYIQPGYTSTSSPASAER